jgi:hypothetical protein
MKPQNAYKIKSYRLGERADENARKVQTKSTIWTREVTSYSVMLFGTVSEQFSHLYEREVVRWQQDEICLLVLRNQIDVCLPS